MRRVRARGGFAAALGGRSRRRCRRIRPSPAGAGKAATVRLCSDCHGLARVVATRQTLAQWRDTLDEMQDNGLEASPRELAARGGRAALPAGKIGAKGCEIPQGQTRQWRVCAPGKQMRRGPSEAQRRLGATGPQVGASTSGTRAAGALGPAPTNVRGYLAKHYGAAGRR